MILRIGDPHVRPDNLEESRKLIQFIAETARLSGVSQIEFLGDLFHTHRLIRMEVQKFWIESSKMLSGIATVVHVVGNHDQSGDLQSESAMSALDVLKDIPNVIVVDKPTVVGSATYLPHTADLEKFYAWVREADTKYLVCHQTFDGAQYENGFYSEGGVSVESVQKFELVVSGHIHKTQRFANIFYPGTPRWDSVSDANENKGIWLVDSEWNHTMVPTRTVCRPLISIEVREGEEIPTPDPETRTHMKLIGTSSWIAAVSKKLKGQVKISAKPTDTRFSGTERKLASLEDYATQFKFDDGVKVEDVIEYLKGTV